ncbi:hypothetical protein AWM68_17355 [Fictibacillus phosphorivorans]|uniref:Polymerase nucleotidyl transferase domain-containing protein n=1 Tax=Fictibacillus phosphorivorans TaxID=1221500 RepID=A0A165NWB4_9BACL|nr:nucleotidyltransferase domain-containing protein [Fictibacillus phosphorivorans]KZE67940.1 hypothetical protein AWM68_17355 [Fictibacillus phosphorivorans]
MKAQSNFNTEAILTHVNKHIQECTEDFYNQSDFKPTFICLVGSRVAGTNKEYSDLDIAIQYKGDAREGDIHHALNSIPLSTDEFIFDFMPFSEEKGNCIELTKPYLALYELDEFDPLKMKRFIKKDGLLKFVYKDLVSKDHSEEDAARLIFNSYVLGDPVMEAEYNKL